MSEQVLPPATIQEDPKARAKADKAYAKAMRPWYKKKRFIIPLLLVIIFALSQATKGGSTPETTSTGANDTAQAGSGGQGDAGAPAAGAAKVGQKVRDGKFEFVVTKVQQGVKSVGDKYLGQKAQGQFVLIKVTVTNIGDESQMLADSSQKVRDAKGREFSADTAAGIYLEDNKVFINEINPGNTVKGTLVYDMPKDTKPTSIELHDSPFSEGVTVKFG